MTGLAALTAPGAAAGEPAAENPRSVEFRGAPPFNRHGKADADADAQLTARSVRSTGVAVRGRPPFKRGLEVQESADTTVFARLEETDEAPRRVRRPGPPGKRAPFVTR
ncbi:MAG: hypothetical protein AAFU65_02625 [Pseudomonadota bacterium]